MHTIRLITAALAGVALSYAVDTSFWVQNDRADFEKATLKKLSMRSDGRLTLAPVVRELLDSSTPYLWALATDSKGNLYAGGGGPGVAKAKVFAIDPAGKTRTLAELDGLEVHALAVDKRDRVYAATVPDGKVYRIDPAAGGATPKAEVFYDPKARYIWALGFASDGSLYVATGDQGEIHRVTPDGKGSVFFRTDETHARSLAIDGHDNLIVGTEPGGLVLRVSPAGEGFVLYQSPKREITAVAASRDGAVFAAGVGPKMPVSPQQPTPALVSAQQAAGGHGAPEQINPHGMQQGPAGGTARPGGAPPPTMVLAPSVAGGSEVYRIEPDGYPHRVWTHPTDVAYALAFDAQGHPLVGTGNKGNIYRIDSDLQYTLLVNAAPTQVTAFSPAGARGGVYAATGNIGKVYQVGPETERQGTAESEVFDAGSFCYWGRLQFHGEAKGGKLTFETRSGNQERALKNWSAWAAPAHIAGVDDGGRIVSPAARFVAWRATLEAASSGSASPQLDGIEVAYQPKNAPPVVEALEATPPNYKFPSPTLNITPAQTISLPPIGQHKRTPSNLHIDPGNTLTFAKGWIGARWNASDPNEDTLMYKLEIKGVNESTWQLVKDKIRDRYYAWDSTAFADGDYQVRVTASDCPSNTPEAALTAQLVSDPFIIDNTPPLITGLTGKSEGNKLVVRWRAKDARNTLGKAEYSVNGGDWTVVDPTTRLTDTPEHDYVLTLDRPASGEITVAVRVSDDADNQGVDKVVIR